MLQETLAKIREAEEQAAEMISQVRREARDIQEAAAKEIRAMDKASQDETAQARARLISEAEMRGEEEASKIRSKTDRHIQQLVEAAESHMNAAVVEIKQGLLG